MRHAVHDYNSAGGYFVTSVTCNRSPLFGTIHEGSVMLSPAGKIVIECWNALPNYYPRVILDAVQIMPDHIHGILLLTDPKLLELQSAEATSLSEIMRGFKSMSARRINKLLHCQGQAVWQAGFNDRVIRSDEELDKFRNYIQTNPMRS